MNKTIRILLIEDNPGDARLLKEMLREADVRFELECVDRLSSGIEKVKSVGFDIILLDLGLPDSRGLVALTRLNEIRPEAPIIVLTGHANESMGIQAVQEGAQDFLVKGQVDKNLLVRSINYAIQRKKIQGALQKSESRLRTLVQTIPDLIWLKDPDGVYLSCNAMFERFFGAKEADIVGKTDHGFVDRELADSFRENDRKAMAAGKPTSNEEWVTFADDGHQALLYTLKTPMLDDKGNVIGILGIAHDITARKQSEETLKETLNRSEMLTQEIVALLKASKAVLENKDFGPTAREIFNECKQLLGATAGYVALLSSDGAENEVLFLDSGGRPCTVDLHLLMPIRGLLEKAYKTGKTVYDNNFGDSDWMQYLPEGQVTLDNAMFVPLAIDGKVVGVIGLANKPEGFNDNDARIATGFGETAAIALQNSRTFELLENSEMRLNSIVQTATDGIISIDAHGKIVLWNKGAEQIFGYAAEEVYGKDMSIIVPARYVSAHQQTINDIRTTGKMKNNGRAVEVSGLRKDGSEVPIEVTTAKWETTEGIFFTAMIRNITDRKRAEAEMAQLTLDAHARETELLRYREQYHTTQQESAFKKELNIIRNDLFLKKIDVVNSRGVAVEWLLDVYYKPLDILSGDSYSIREVEEGKALIYLADAMGKGLSASVTSILSTSFVNHLVDEAKEGTGFDFGEFIAAYSKFIRKELIEEEIMCVTFIFLDLINETMDTAICAMPPVLCHAADNAIVMIENNNLPLMIYPAEMRIDRYDISGFRKILAHTDGLNESLRNEDSLYQEYLEDDFRQSEFKRDFLDKFGKSVEKPDDDITFIFLHRIDRSPKWTKDFTVAPRIEELTAVTMELEAFLATLDADTEFKVMFSSSFTEILMNAYEHGSLNIALEKKISLLADDTDIYNDHLVNAERNAQNEIIITLSLQELNGKDYLMLTVADKGNGFDTTVLQESVRDSCSLNGRGIQMALCSTDELFYNKVGNEVTLLKKIIRG